MISRRGVVSVIKIIYVHLYIIIIIIMIVRESVCLFLNEANEPWGREIIHSE